VFTYPTDVQVRRAHSKATYNYGFIVKGWQRDRAHADNLQTMRILALAYGE
jgi:hypothetical protein